MPFDPSKIPVRLIDAVRKRNVVPLIGAGFSKQAGDAFPNWRQLMSLLNERALAIGRISKKQSKEIKGLLDRGQFLMAGEALRTDLPSDVFQTVLEEQFNPKWAKPTLVHRALFRLRPPMILTTNYDALLEDAYAVEYQKSAAVLTSRNVTEVQLALLSDRLPDYPIIFKIHGSIRDYDTIILSERDYRDLLYRNPGDRKSVV